MNNYEIIACTIDFIEEHLSEDNLNLELIAAYIGYSKYHLHRMFKAITHFTPHEYIQKRRLNEACRMLIKSDRPVIEIAQEAGYESQRSFTRAFKLIAKKSPAAYRKQGIFMPLQLRLDILSFNKRREKAMNARIIEVGEMKLVGVKGDTKFNFDGIGRCWHKLHKKKHQIMYRSDKNTLIGINDYSEFEKDKKHPVLKVMAAAEVSLFENVPKGLETCLLPPSRYAVFSFHGRNEDSMQSIAELIYSEWFPQSDLIFNERNLYDLIKYSEITDDKGESDIEYWVPII